jgi:DNA-binding response OmpR family regulator
VGHRTCLPVNLLMVDDDAPLSCALRSSLAAQGYLIAEARNGQEALHWVLQPRANLVLLDTEAPNNDGREICRRLRERVPEAGIVVLTGCGGKREKIRMLEAGADAYITKPIDFPLLMARLQALSRPSETPGPIRSGIVRAADLELDLENRTLRHLGVHIHLSPTEFSLLAYLMQNADLPLDNKKLLRAIWGCGNHNELDYVVQPYIRRLRRKIEGNINTPVHLLRVPGFGYSFCSQSRPATHDGAVASAHQAVSSPVTSDATPEKEAVERILCLSLRRLRKAIQTGWISFPSQVPVFARESRPDIQWRLVELYFVHNWSCSDLGRRYAVTMERVRQVLCAWVRRAAWLGYLQEIQRAVVHRDRAEVEALPNTCFSSPWGVATS